MKATFFILGLKKYAILILTSIFNSAIVLSIVAQIRQGVIHLREIRYKNATVKIKGDVDIDKIKAATIKFFRKVQRSNDKYVSNKTRSISKK